MRVASSESEVMIYGGCNSGNCSGLWCVRTGSSGVVSAKPCCETCETSEAGLISMLQSELDRKNEQLAVKDRRIEELNARLSEVSSALVAAQQTAAAAQALHAGTIQQQNLTGEGGADQRGLEPVQKRGWLWKIFYGYG